MSFKLHHRKHIEHALTKIVRRQLRNTAHALTTSEGRQFRSAVRALTEPWRERTMRNLQTRRISG